MKCLSIARPKALLDEAIVAARSLDPTVVFFFAAPSVFRDSESMARIAQGLDGLLSIGCSTSGEITQDGLHEDSIVLLSVRFDHSFVRAASAKLQRAKQSLEAGQQLAAQLHAPVLRAVFVLSGGMTTNGSALVRGLYEKLPPDTIITGGLAGDETQFRQTFTFLNGAVYEDQAVAVGFYGEQLEISASSEGGWRPFGAARRVTKSEDNILLELDEKPALQLYDEYLGANDRTASRLAYPFAILRDDRSNAGVIRAALDIDRSNNSLILAGDLPQGSLVCLMHADNDGLIQGAAQAAAEAIRTHPSRHQEGFALVVSCVARRMVMDIDAEDEIEAVRDSFDDGTPMAGFYSYGEIGPLPKTLKPELHNQTMTITYITERKLS